MSTRDERLKQLRLASFSIAYRMLGSVSEAEDVVQEALLRLHRAIEDGDQIESPRAFVATVTTRLAIDELRSARARRERYTGDWLPEPVLTDGEDDPVRHAEMADSLSHHPPASCRARLTQPYPRRSQRRSRLATRRRSRNSPSAGFSGTPGRCPQAEPQPRGRWQMGRLP